MGCGLYSKPATIEDRGNPPRPGQVAGVDGGRPSEKMSSGGGREKMSSGGGREKMCSGGGGSNIVSNACASNGISVGSSNSSSTTGKKLTEKEGLQVNAVLSMTAVREMRAQEIEKMTGQFCELLGRGGFGSVYKGVIKGSNCTRWVAVKVLSSNSRQGIRELVKEIQILPNLHHRHLVSLIGYCNEATCQALVYEYIPNGTLNDHLHCRGGLAPLTWRQRLAIALDVARALSYLHLHVSPAIVHRDIKPSNVLLDNKMHAKLADFGLSKMFADDEFTHLTTDIKGTAGYLDPEYYTTQRLSEKTDIYSFGVLLMELISGKPPLGITAQRQRFDLVKWARVQLGKGNVERVLDKKVAEGTYSVEALWRLADGAMLCCEPYSANRPGIGEITRKIQEAIDLQNLSDNGQSTQGVPRQMMRAAPELHGSGERPRSADVQEEGREAEGGGGGRREERAPFCPPFSPHGGPSLPVQFPTHQGPYGGVAAGGRDRGPYNNYNHPRGREGGGQRPYEYNSAYT
ncbi:hypothetical protein CBR_g19807 [Chara braunii]|uniref:non-specific serine/threonine protein kinase n=1 Tax=Chara braunii TaxID=69332 RepID=A0A388JU06_CHABU|nr:hypothetical protein CBR_g19807 [Chara braunii]|eukprot:GBG61275.1 hypothetical protein CBR_g19807 [Chara braunii]